VTGCKPNAVLVEHSSDEGTLFDASIVAPGANSVLFKLLLSSLPHRSIDDRLMLPRMAEVSVSDLAGVN
jgi:hypothetical protein